MTRVEGETDLWQRIISVARGVYRYKLLVDGEWQVDPANERRELNDHGVLNSVIAIEEANGHG
jgi:hypothetical protein